MIKKRSKSRRAKQVHAFHIQLQKLYEKRVHWLKSRIQRKKRGAPPEFNRKTVDVGIKSLQKNATVALLNSSLIPKLSKIYTIKKQWHVKGWGNTEKKKFFREWYDRVIDHDNCVYIFWNNRKCLYVGRTLNGKGRPSNHFDKDWVNQTTRIDILSLSNRRCVPQLECLATHKYRPSKSKIKPAKKKWFSKCPICEVHKDIRDEVKKIFRIK